MMIIKETINYVIKPFTYICNQSFSMGTFPSKMKIAKVVPIYKNGNKHFFNNYRPISLLPQFSKISEKLFVVRLDNFLDKFNLINEQYGFRANRSTSMAVTALVEDIATAIDNKEFAIGVFIDLSKAFDTIDHERLLKKMYRFGVRGPAYVWIQSYLCDRYQYVHINNSDSAKKLITHGVPQGSILGPKMFIMYINDVCEALKNTNALYMLMIRASIALGRICNSLLLWSKTNS